MSNCNSNNKVKEISINEIDSRVSSLKDEIKDLKSEVEKLKSQMDDMKETMHTPVSQWK